MVLSWNQENVRTYGHLRCCLGAKVFLGSQSAGVRNCIKYLFFYILFSFYIHISSSILVLFCFIIKLCLSQSMHLSLPFRFCPYMVGVDGTSERLLWFWLLTVIKSQHADIPSNKTGFHMDSTPCNHLESGNVMVTVSNLVSIRSMLASSLSGPYVRSTHRMTDTHCPEKSLWH